MIPTLAQQRPTQTTKYRLDGPTWAQYGADAAPTSQKRTTWERIRPTEPDCTQIFCKSKIGFAHAPCPPPHPPPRAKLHQLLALFPALSVIIANQVNNVVFLCFSQWWTQRASISFLADFAMARHKSHVKCTSTESTHSRRWNDLNPRRNDKSTYFKDLLKDFKINSKSCFSARRTWNVNRPGSVAGRPGLLPWCWLRPNRVWRCLEWRNLQYLQGCLQIDIRVGFSLVARLTRPCSTTSCKHESIWISCKRARSTLVAKMATPVLEGRALAAENALLAWVQSTSSSHQ